jgi:hypothetical protein
VMPVQPQPKRAALDGSREIREGYDVLRHVLTAN